MKEGDGAVGMQHAFTAPFPLGSFGFDEGGLSMKGEQQGLRAHSLLPPSAPAAALTGGGGGGGGSGGLADAFPELLPECFLAPEREDLVGADDRGEELMHDFLHTFDSGPFGAMLTAEGDQPLASGRRSGGSSPEQYPGGGLLGGLTQSALLLPDPESPSGAPGGAFSSGGGPLFGEVSQALGGDVGQLQPTLSLPPPPPGGGASSQTGHLHAMKSSPESIAPRHHPRRYGDAPQGSPGPHSFSSALPPGSSPGGYYGGAAASPGGYAASPGGYLPRGALSSSQAEPSPTMSLDAGGSVSASPDMMLDVHLTRSMRAGAMDRQALWEGEDAPQADPPGEQRRPRGKGGRQPAADPRLDPSIDPKKAKRILANRLSAARSKMKQKTHVEALRKKVSVLSYHRTEIVSEIADLRTTCKQFIADNLHLTNRLEELSVQHQELTEAQAQLGARREQLAREAGGDPPGGAPLGSPGHMGEDTHDDGLLFDMARMPAPQPASYSSSQGLAAALQGAASHPLGGLHPLKPLELHTAHTFPLVASPKGSALLAPAPASCFLPGA